jgi:hypothetical protein
MQCDMRYVLQSLRLLQIYAWLMQLRKRTLSGRLRERIVRIFRCVHQFHGSLPYAYDAVYYIIGRILGLRAQQRNADQNGYQIALIDFYCSME